VSFLNLIQFRKGPPCERSEPLFPLNFVLHFRSLLQFRAVPQFLSASSNGPCASVASCPFRNNLFLNFPGFRSVLHPGPWVEQRGSCRRCRAGAQKM
jgi:hypothetical protein